MLACCSVIAGNMHLLLIHSTWSIPGTPYSEITQISRFGMTSGDYVLPLNYALSLRDLKMFRSKGIKPSCSTNLQNSLLISY